MNSDVFVSDSHSTKPSETAPADQSTRHVHTTTTLTSHSTAAAREVRGSASSPLSTPCHPQHGEQHDQGRDRHRIGQDGRTSSKDLVQNGDAHSHGRVASPSWVVSQPKGQTSHTTATDGGAPQRGSTQEGRSGPIRDQGVGSGHHPQRHDQDHAPEGSCSNLRPCGGLSRGSSGIRRTLSFDIPRSAGSLPKVCGVGTGHLQGGPLLCPSGQACSLEPCNQGAGHQHADPDGGQPSGSGEDGLCQRDQDRQGRNFSDICRIREFCSDVEHHRGGDDGPCTVSQGIDRRSQESQGGEEHPSQEAQQQQRWLLREAAVVQDLQDPLSVSDQAFHDQPGEVGLSGTLEKPRQQLRTSEGRHLNRRVDRMLHEVIDQWVPSDKTILMEVACGPDSLLSSTMQEITGRKHTAQRFALWNQHDLRSSDGVKSVLTSIDRLDPKHVWLAPECGPYSVMQNINQRTEQQIENLELKRRDALKQYVGCAIIFQYCIQKGIHVTWELSQTCQAWRLPLLQKLVAKYEPHFAVIRGCQVNLRDDKGRFIKKGWRIMSTHTLMADRMNLPCNCDHRTPHVACEGSLTRKTAYYTKEFAKRVCEAILHDTTRQQLHDEFQGLSKHHGMFGSGTVCVCEDGRQHGSNVQCGLCTEETMGRVHKRQTLGEGLTAETKSPSLPKDWNPEEVRRRLYLLHAATGHGSKRHLVQVLKTKGVHPKILEMAEGFECPVCRERQRPQPRNLSSLEPVPQKFEVVSADVGHWINPKTKEKHQFVMFVDEGSKFRVARFVLKGKHQHVSASLFISTFRECWTQYFGYPRTLRLDPDGAFRSIELSDFCDQQQIFLDLIPGEAHWKLGTCERSIQATKTILEKVIDDQPELDSTEALAEAIRVQNMRETVRGYSPMQHVLGLAPDELGTILSNC